MSNNFTQNITKFYREGWARLRIAYVFVCVNWNQGVSITNCRFKKKTLKN